MDAPSNARPANDWSRIGRGTVLPILLLVALLVVLGHVHIDLATGYTAPRVVAEDKEALIFFDEGGREPAFYYRRSADAGLTFGKRVRVPGVLGGAVLQGDRLVALLADDPDDDGARRWFYSLYDRKTLERRWSGTFDDPELGLTNPCHLARLGDQVYAFGTDAEGALRIARLGESGALVPVEARGPGAAIAVPGPDAPSPVPPPALFTSAVATQGGAPRLVLFWRVVAPAGTSGASGELRWATFDGKTLAPWSKLPVDVIAASAVTAPTGEAMLLGVAPDDEEHPAILVWRLGGAGLEPVEQVPYTREGFAGGSGIAALGAAVARDRLLVVAQIGSSIRYRSKEGSAWSEWQDVARVPTEQKAVVYGWGASLLALSAALLLQGLAALRRRRRAPTARRARTLDELCAEALAERRGQPAAAPALPAAQRATGAPLPEAEAARASAPADASAGADDDADDDEVPEAAPLPERALAFAVDVGIVIVLCAVLLGVAPGAAERAATDPKVRLALGALFVAVLVTYFAVLEALFARTPGKRLLDLEVQDLAGGRPTRAALLFRNLFRVELLLPPPYLAMMVSVLVMLASPHRQRPGDLVARTAVRRARPAGA
jgi:uncharacterized RDD family membrane protein YckC